MLENITGEIIWSPLKSVDVLDTFVSVLKSQFKDTSTELSFKGN